MAKAIGRLADVGVGRESTRGTGVAATLWLPKQTAGFDDVANKVDSALAYGNIGMGNDSYVTHLNSEGELGFDMGDQTIGYFLYAAIGTLNSSGPTDSAYTHTLTLLNSNQHTSLTLHIKEANVAARRYTRCMVDELTFDLKPDDVVKVTAKLVANPSQDTVDTPAYTAENKFLGRHLTFKLASLASGLAAAAQISVKSLKFTIKNNVVLDHVMGATVQPEDILNRNFEITGEVEIDYQDRTYVNLMKNGTYNAVRIQLTNTDVVIGASTRPTFTLDLSRCHFSAWTVNRNNDEIMSQKFTFTALYDITNSNVINSCTLVNGKAAYTV